MIAKNCCKFLHTFKRRFASNAKVKLNEDVVSDINNEIFKPRNHPGRNKIKTTVLPQNLLKAIEHVVEDHPIKALVNDSRPFARHLQFRLPPVEAQELKEIKRKVLHQVTATATKSSSNSVDEENFKQSIKDKVQNKLRQKVYNWKPINYNVYNSLLYLFARFAPEYAVLVNIFSEVNVREPDFKPRSLFDFGSGTGTVTWAANLYWKKFIFEYFNVDSSGDMNDLALLLLQDGKGTKLNSLKGTFYRQFLPANNISYDLVVCAYSLLELPSAGSRLQTILNLWNKTSQFLIVVEQGTKAGFKVVNEVRDFILGIEDEANIGHVFSPCPHDLTCPRFLTDNALCNFEVKYHALPFFNYSIQKEQYSYVILKKGKRDPNDNRWPRLIEAPLVRSKHSICRMCTASGKLQEVIFTASKHGKMAYYCARSSDWGDRLPIGIEENESKESVETCKPGDV